MTPKAEDGIIESIRVLRVAFTSARDSRGRVALQIRDLLITAPEGLRRALGPLSTADRAARCSRFRVHGQPPPTFEGTNGGTANLAGLNGGADQGDVRLELALIGSATVLANPALRGAKGVRVDVAAILLVAAGDNPGRIRTEAAFVAMCGVNPIEASSGKIVRHRLNRSGNRQANHALWRIVMVRMTNDETTKKYIARRKAEGRTQREAIRCLKRYVAREVYRLVVDPQAVPSGTALRATREAAGLSLRQVSHHLGVSLTQVSRFELGRVHDTELATR